MDETSVLPDRIRAFVAAYPPPAVLRILEEWQTMWCGRFSGPGIRWSRFEQRHLTLQFLGDIETSRLPEYSRVIAEACSLVAPFSLRLSRPGCFPESGAPRVLWIGLEGALDALCRLKHGLDEALRSVEFHPEDRNFHPHLTLARIQSGTLPGRRVIADWKAAPVPLSKAAWRVDEVALMQSVLSNSGAVHNRLGLFSLSGKMTGGGRRMSG